MASSQQLNSHGAEPSNHLLKSKSRALMSLFFEESPSARFFFYWGAPAIFIGYPAIIALAKIQGWRWSYDWLEEWEPAVKVFRQIIPLFDNFQDALSGENTGRRITFIHHVIAVEMTIFVPIFFYFVIAILSKPRENWSRVGKAASRLSMMLNAAGWFALFALSGYWTVIGWGLKGGSYLFAWHKSDISLLGIGVFFWCAFIFGLMTLVAAGSLVWGWDEGESKPPNNTE